MQSSRALSRAARSFAAFKPALPLNWSLPWRDLPILSRYGGHLILGLLLLTLIYGVSPLRLDTPYLGALDMTESANVDGALALPAYESVEPAANARHLEPGTIPFTIRTWGQALPMVEEPRRVVRTSVTVYTVQPGDTVLGIAHRFGLRGTTLLNANQSLADEPDVLSVGQQLYILPVDGVYHTVARGETLQTIATRYRVEVDAITSFPGNELSAPYELTQGQRLIVPGGVRPYVPRAVTTFRATGAVTRAGVAGTGQFAWPMSGRITQGFWAGHRAIDIGAPRGTPILAADSGTVVAAHFHRGYGNMVVIDHGNGYQTLYAHFDAFYVQVGQVVSKGQVIGRCGSTGNSTGPHLHFEVRQGGSLLNPFSYLP